MAMRSIISRSSLVGLLKRDVICSSPASARRFSSGGAGRVLDEEEKAIENMYIKKMEKEKLEQKHNMEKENAEKDKSSQKSDGAAKAERK